MSVFPGHLIRNGPAQKELGGRSRRLRLKINHRQRQWLFWSGLLLLLATVFAGINQIIIASDQQELRSSVREERARIWQGSNSVKSGTQEASATSEGMQKWVRSAE